MKQMTSWEAYMIKIVDRRKFDRDLYYLVADSLDFSDRHILDMYSSLSDEQCKEAARLLNVINNQQITKLNPKQLTYETLNALNKDGNSIPIFDFSTSEKVFMLAYFSKVYKKQIAVVWGLEELTLATLSKFFRLFKDVECLTICADGIFEIKGYEFYI